MKHPRPSWRLNLALLAAVAATSAIPLPGFATQLERWPARLTHDSSDLNPGESLPGPGEQERGKKGKGPESWTGNINLFFGAKALDEADWAPVDSQSQFGVKMDFRQRSWPVNIAVDILASDSGDVDDFDPVLGDIVWNGATTEINLGVRKYWELEGDISPFVGGGVSFVDGEFTLTDSSGSESDSGSGVGFWLDAGVTVAVGQAFNVGLEIGVSIANIDSDLAGTVDAGGGHFGVTLGFHF